ncbi:hypothetical protein [Prosthecobacter fusiformis]|nr:hypothetical protein [Prosthecobacter fusiformis]
MQASATETQLGAISPVRAAGEPEADAAPSPAEDADPAHYRRAYLLSLDSGKLSLENTEDIQGDFAMRRGPQEEWSGMLRCRLVSEEGKVLAEELLPAPDHLCTVLDSYDGTPKPVSYTVAGPVMFQLRLPRLAAATRLDISRITGPGALARDIPVGSLSLTSP